jgi:hypothetical protein
LRNTTVDIPIQSTVEMPLPSRILFILSAAASFPGFRNAPPDPFLIVADGKAVLRWRDLQQLAQFLRQNPAHSQVEASLLPAHDEAFSALSLAHGLILLKTALGSSFFQAFDCVDAFLKGGDETSL